MRIKLYTRSELIAYASMLPNAPHDLEHLTTDALLDLVNDSLETEAEREPKQNANQPIFNPSSMLKRTEQRLNKALRLQAKYRDKHGFGWTPYDQDVSIQLERKQALQFQK